MLFQLLAGQGVTLETFVVPVGDPHMKLEWFLNKEPLLFKSSFTPVYDYGFIGLSISKVYPDDFGLMTVRVSNKHGSAEMESWLGDYPAGQVTILASHWLIHDNTLFLWVDT